MTTLHAISAPVFVRTLSNLSAILDKAAAHAEARKIDPAVLLASRLYPDMFPLVRQVQLSSDFAKGTMARLAGQEPPKYEDNETTFADLIARIAKTVAFVQGIKPEQLAGAEERDVTVKMRDQSLTFKGLPYLLTMALPNFFFHVTTAYNILRENGVELGKRDFIGAP